MRHIRQLLDAGLSTAAIAELGTCVRDEPPTPACAGALARLRDERDRIDRAVGNLLATRAALDAVIEGGDNHPSDRTGARRSRTQPARRKPPVA